MRRRRQDRQVLRVEIDFGHFLEQLAPILRLLLLSRSSMHSHATPGVDHGQVQLEPSPVAGRIDAVPGDLIPTLERYLAYMKGRGKREKSIDALRQLVTAASLERGWQSVAHFTYPEVTGWFTSKRERGDWMGQTLNRNLSLFRGFTKWLAKQKLITENFLADEEGAALDDETGSRAASTLEAQRMLEYSFVRCMTDRRSESNRAAYWACLFLAGCRAGEPEQWKWKQLHLDEEIPSIQFPRKSQKNNSIAIIALAPELVEILRRHRVQMRKLAGRKPAINRKPRKGEAVVRAVSPDNPEAFVFAISPPRATFRDDRRGAGIEELDPYGARFSPHSCRKWFETTLTSRDVSQTRVDTLMRHGSNVRARYDKPELLAQLDALRRLPRLWPERFPGLEDPSGAHAVQNPDSGRILLTDGVHLGHDGPATPNANHPSNTSVKPPPPAHPGQRASQLPPFSGEAGVVGLADLLQALQSGLNVNAGPQGLGSTFTSSGIFEMPITEQQKVNPNALADLFEVLARLLRTGAGHEGRSPKSAESA